MTKSLPATRGSASSKGVSGAEKPLIGVTTSTDRIKFGAWDTDAAYVPLSYVRAVERSGGRVVLIPPRDDGVDETLDTLDGLVISGGDDVNPAAYGADPHPETFGVDAERDHGELALLRRALERDMPVLAICRGMQVMNVAKGGDLVQHLPELVGTERHKHTPGQFADHDVELKPGTRVARILGDRAPVKSHHHQALGRLGSDLVEAAWADDGTVEAVEDPSRRFALGVLWHPEAGEDFALFAELVYEARAYRARRE